jgi:hypothetical protein
MRGREDEQQTATSPAKKEIRPMKLPRNLSSYRFRRRGALAVLVAAAALLAAAVAAPMASAEFGLNNFDVTYTNQDGSTATQAGSHPYAMTTEFGVNYTEPGSFEWIPDGELRDSIFDQVPGFVGDSTSMPTCSNTDFFNRKNLGGAILFNACPPSTAVGLVANFLEAPFFWVQTPVYNLKPPPGVAVRLGFKVILVPVIVDISVKQGGDYNVEATLSNTPQALTVFGSKFQLWGNPGDPGHDPVRGFCGDNVEGEGEPTLTRSGPYAYLEGGACKIEPTKPFLTLPRSCTGPAASTFEADSWQNPGVWVKGGSVTHDNAVPPNPQGFTGCGKLSFAPAIEAKASTKSAETGTGLDFNLDFHDEGLTSPTGLAQSDAKKVEVTLPEGVTVNPSVGEGLGVCTPSQLDMEKIDTPAGDGCPNASKIGTVHVETQLLDQPVDGDVFLAQQDDPATTAKGAENPFDSLLAFYMVLRNPEKGIFVKIPARVEPDPKTGQLITTVEDIPQLPFSHFDLHFREGQRAPLVSPPACGSYDTVAKLTPWSDPSSTVTQVSTFQITKGVGGGACPPGGVPPFHPEFEAGSINNNAKSYSPFNMRLIRHDGEQDMTKFSSILPPGVLGKLAGVSKCSDAAIEAAKVQTGRQELTSPSCPSNSEIGHTLAGAGVGGALTYVPGQIYLGGPYKGDPLSVVSVTPAVAGPFDAGTVVVRLALTLNPETAEVEVDGAASDPIPHILKGIPLKVRDLRVYVDRNDFIINPTSCNPSSAKATLFGSFLDVFNPADDVPVDLSSRYQAANCLNLGFKPKLSLKLKGGTKRGDHPALRAELNARPGDANIGSAVVTLPRSAFLDQAHIRTICTRVQFAAKACPPGAQYGYARAWTPLLDEPIEGPVYLRSSNHKLPDLVVALHGLVDVNVSSRIDSKNGGIRNSFETIPDAPVTKFVLSLQGGKKGLVVNSRSLCSAPSRADALFTGQNGVPYHFHPLLQPSCGGKSKKRK